MAAVSEVKAYLAAHGIDVLEYEQLTATAATAAEAVGCSAAEIAKTLLFLIGGKPVVVVTCGDMKVKSSPLKKEFQLQGKVKLPQAEDVVNHTGYAPGGVCPFLLPGDLPVCLDSSIMRFDVVYAAAGNSHTAVPVTLEQLKQLTGGRVAELCSPIVLKD